MSMFKRRDFLKTSAGIAATTSRRSAVAPSIDRTRPSRTARRSRKPGALARPEADPSACAAAVESDLAAARFCLLALELLFGAAAAAAAAAFGAASAAFLVFFLLLWARVQVLHLWPVLRPLFLIGKSFVVPIFLSL